MVTYLIIATTKNHNLAKQYFATKQLTWTNKQLFWVTHFPIPTCSLSRKNIFPTIFIIVLLCAILCPIIMHYLPMELEYTIHYLSPDSFRYVVSTLFLYAGYVELCLTNWWTFFLIKKLCNLCLIEETQLFRHLSDIY